MAEIVNLRMARKAKARAQAEQQAAENRAKFGRAKAEKIRLKTEGERQVRKFDGVRRESQDHSAN